MFLLKNTTNVLKKPDKFLHLVLGEDNINTKALSST